MASPKVLVTGVTGYIGGDAFHQIYHAHPDWEYTCLVRSPERGVPVSKAFPKACLVYGDLDSAALLEEESKKADMMLHFASADHEAGAQALLKGAQSRTAPSFLIHTSGTGILEFPDLERSNYGEADLSSWDDIADISKLVNDIPDWAPHRNVDKIILDANTNLVKTAIVCPPTIYGSSRGPGNTRSIQIPILTQKMLERGQGFQVGRGLAHWTHVHVHDLSSAYLLLAEAAAAGGGNASWGREGYYFTENGEHVWKDVSEAIAGRLHAQGALKSDAIVSVTADEASEMHPAGKYLWGANSLGRASRARKQLAWKPKAESLVASLDATIAEEARMFEKGKLVKDRT